jgi:(2Fe-2S) ferredoxin
MGDKIERLKSIADKLDIGHYHRHVFLCTGGNCCSSKDGEAAWEALKKELKETKLSLSRGPNACYRTKVGCLRVCSHGPIAVVYPEGVWYHGLTAERIPQFVQQHLIEGKPIDELVFARNPLPNPTGSDEPTGPTD